MSSFCGGTIVGTVAICRLPESPHWLVSVGRDADAAEVLAHIGAGGSGVLRVCPRRLCTPAAHRGRDRFSKMG